MLLSVHCDDSEWVKRAKDVLERTGAQDVASAGERGADYDDTDRPHRRGETLADEGVYRDTTVKKTY
jgi:hypothetical protein